MATVVASPRELRERCDAARASGARVGFVPTMGALHAGHMSLVAAARSQGADFVVVSIFVNPTQFAPGEDLAAYPRTFDADCERCDREGVDLVFAPQPHSMYPDGHSTTVTVEGLTGTLEGAHRPSHFQGVTTVVTKLLASVGPCVAVFGRKDYQQFKVLSRMVRDLMLPITMHGAGILRDGDGLALSSRNRYLSGAERQRALSIVRGLRSAHDAYQAGERQASLLRGLVQASVEGQAGEVDYIASVDPDSLQPIAGKAERMTLLVAVRIGTTRLLDNVELGDDARP